MGSKPEPEEPPATGPMLLNARYPKAAISYMLSRPVLTTDGREQELTWGDNRIQVESLSEGGFTVDARLLGIRIGRGRYYRRPRVGAHLEYKAPYVLVMRGEIGTDARYRGAALFWIVMTLVLLGIVLQLAFIFGLRAALGIESEAEANELRPWRCLPETVIEKVTGVKVDETQYGDGSITLEPEETMQVPQEDASMICYYVKEGGNGSSPAVVSTNKMVEYPVVTVTLEDWLTGSNWFNDKLSRYTAVDVPDAAQAATTAQHGTHSIHAVHDQAYFEVVVDDETPGAAGSARQLLRLMFKAHHAG